MSHSRRISPLQISSLRLLVELVGVLQPGLCFTIGAFHLWSNYKSMTHCQQKISLIREWKSLVIQGMHCGNKYN